MIIVKNREMLIPNHERYIGTTYDNESEMRVFQIPRFSQSGVDLSALTFRLDLKYANNAADTVILSKEVTDLFIYATWEITNSQLQVPGTVYIGIRAADNEATVKWTSFTAAIYVDRHLNTPGNYTGDLTEIEQMEQDHQYFKSVVDELSNNLDYRQDAEAYAVGTRLGEDVPETDEAYHNNSKYYKEVSDQNRQTAEAYAKGTVDGVAVESGDTGYHDNAKYYSELAATSESNAADIANAIAASRNQILANTAAISAEASARSSQDTVLQAQIDQLVAPTGEAPSAAEVENARIGTDGITYSTLGVAIRDQFANVKSQLEEVQESTLSFLPISTTWENGSYEANGYADLPSSTVTRKRSVKLPAGTYIITPTSGLRCEAFYYVSDSSGTQIYSFSASKRTINATGQFIITIAKTDGGSLDGLEVEISQFGIQRQNDELLNIRTISHDSLAVNTDRYEHITYIDRLNGATLQNGNASDVRLNFDIRFKSAPSSVCVTTNPSRENSEIRLNYAESFTLLGTQEFELYLYVKDATLVTAARISIPSASFVKGFTGLVNGWNKIRFISEGAGNWDETVNITQIRIMVYHTSGATEDVYIGSLVQVKPEYANLIVIADGPYYSTYTAAYPTLKTMGVPITWALDATLLDAADAQTRGLININELNLLAKDGISEFSFHSYDGALMSSATKEQALYDTLNSIRFLRENGLQPNHIWRAAWLQNSCANPELANLEVEASASYNGKAGPQQFPFIDNYNIGRNGVAGRDASWFDDIFKRMRMQHCTAVLYFHGVSNGERDITQTMLEYFLDKIEAAISDGYLNPTTYNRLVSYYKKTA